MCSQDIRNRLIPIYEKLGLPTSCSMDPEAVYGAIAHDKKAEDRMIRIVCCDKIGSYEVKKVDLASLKDKVTSVVTSDRT
jgi:3-dehydroquinate synthase